MADIKKITSFDGVTYNIKDASAVSDVSILNEKLSIKWRNGNSSTYNFPNNIKEVTYSELKSLRDNSSLTPGQQYKLTDYVCTTTTTDTSAATHTFDIILFADDTSILNENARAAQHSGDTYFINCDLGAWELKYCLDNDTSRFDWADSTNGKGVIYYMKDEYENECPYDFKNIMYKLYMLDSITWDDATPEDMRSSYEDEFVGHYVGNWIDNINYGTVALSDTNFKYFYTFNKGESDANDVSDGSIPNQDSLDNMCRQNMIPEYIEWDGENRYLLNWIIFKPFSTEDDCFANVFGKNCHNNLFDYGWTYQNTFGNGCSSNTFGLYYDGNTFGDECSSNCFGNNCLFNSFGSECNSNTFGNDCLYNTFGNGCDSNTFGNECNSNTFGNECINNLFGSSCISNTFGNDCSSNSFGNDCYHNSLNDYCKSNRFGNYCGINASGTASISTGNILGYYCQDNVFGDHCYANQLVNATRSSSYKIYNNSFGEGCYSNTLNYGCYDNSFGGGCYSNSLGLYCYGNSFGTECDYNSFGNNCGENSFGNECYYNSFGTECDYNSFGTDCGSNTFGDSCYANSFGNSCFTNSFKNGCCYNSFGNICRYNFFGNYCNSNSFENYCYRIKFGTASVVNDYYQYIHIESGNQYIYLNSTGTRSSSQYYQNVIIGAGLNNTTTYKTIADTNVAQTYETKYVANNSKTILI